MLEALASARRQENNWKGRIKLFLFKITYFFCKKSSGITKKSTIISEFNELQGTRSMYKKIIVFPHYSNEKLEIEIIKITFTGAQKI